MLFAVFGNDGDFPHHDDELFLNREDLPRDERIAHAPFQAGASHAELGVEFIERAVAANMRIGLGHPPSKKEAGGALIAGLGCNGH